MIPHVHHLSDAEALAAVREERERRGLPQVIHMESEGGTEVSTATLEEPTAVKAPTTITFPRAQLHAALLKAAAACPTRTALPVLNCVRIQVKAGEATFAGTGLDTTVIVRMPVESDAEAAVCLPAKLTAEIVGRAQGQEVTLEVEPERAVLRAGRSRAEIPGVKVEEFPLVEEEDFTNARELDGERFRAWVRQVSPFVAGDKDVRHNLKGVLWEVAPGGERMIALNGHVFGAASSCGEQSGEPLAVVPAQALRTAASLSGKEGAIRVSVDANRIALRAGAVDVYARNIDQNDHPYPTWRQVVPRNFAQRAVLHRASLIAALERVASVASDNTRRVALTFSAETLHLRAQSESGRVEDGMACDLRGEGLRVGFNASYLLSLLPLLDGEEVEVAMNTPTTATIWRNAGDEDERLFYIVMPLRALED